MPEAILDTYRFIRFTKEPKQGKRGRIEDVVKVYFDIDSAPESYYTPDQFIEFLNSQFSLDRKHPSLLSRIKTALASYGIHFILDVKKMNITALEVAPERVPGMKEEMHRMMKEQLGKPPKGNTSGFLSDAAIRKGTKDVFDRLGEQSLN